MTKFLNSYILNLFLFCFFAIQYSCQLDRLNEGDLNPVPNTGDVSTSTKSKTDVCHNGHIINISNNALGAHQRHGDAVDMDGDGYFDIASVCGEVDCNDSDDQINSGQEEICGNQIDDDCDGLVDEDCELSILPIAYYPFNGNANDESGNGNNGTVNGANLTMDRFGNENSAYSFDGINQNIQITSAPENALGTTNFSISTWFKSSSPDEMFIWNKSNTNCGDTEVGPSIGFLQSGDGTLSVVADLSTTYTLNSLDAVNDGAWHFAVLVRENNTMTLYLDGLVENSIAIALDADFTTSLDLYIGGTTLCGNFYQGDIDEFSIYNQALSGAEISEMYD
ncbi:LamG-like jellyroll fold domain-containing protein [Eudoraea adriatica]|uniref:LamG-like jellyroll fold domain-containing protein n=1 Tax=Eudoraea adriatica TaxID=446681 RepID=UPI000A057B0F|nr:LamG-like jellyroll fold domain-containing protein [Eudoraea adriatica]